MQEENNRLEDIKQRRHDIEKEVQRLQREATKLKKETSELLISQKKSYIDSIEKFIKDASMHYFSYVHSSKILHKGVNKGNMLVFQMQQTEDTSRCLVFMFGESGMSPRVINFAFSTMNQSTRHKVKCQIFRPNHKYKAINIPSEIEYRVELLREILLKGPTLESTALVKEVIRPYHEKIMSIREAGTKFGL
jgi:hypothetical protein